MTMAIVMMLVEPGYALDTALPMHPKPQLGEARLKDAFLRAPCKAPDPTPLPMLSGGTKDRDKQSTSSL